MFLSPSYPFLSCFSPGSCSTDPVMGCPPDRSAVLAQIGSSLVLQVLLFFSWLYRRFNWYPVTVSVRSNPVSSVIGLCSVPVRLVAFIINLRKNKIKSKKEKNKIKNVTSSGKNKDDRSGWMTPGVDTAAVNVAGKCFPAFCSTVYSFLGP